MGAGTQDMQGTTRVLNMIAEGFHETVAKLSVILLCEQLNY